MLSNGVPAMNDNHVSTGPGAEIGSLDENREMMPRVTMIPESLSGRHQLLNVLRCWTLLSGLDAYRT